MDNILDIIYQYSINNNLLDEIAIRKIVDIVINSNNIDTLREIKFLNNPFLTDDFTIASYNIKGYMVVYNNAIKKEINLDSQITNFKIENQLSSFEKNIRKNLHILYIILHELEHAKQINEIKYLDDTVERKLLRAEFFYIYPVIKNNIENVNLISIEYIKHKLIVNQNYNISIMERLADINALYNVKDLSKEISSNIYELQDLILLDNLLREYKDKFDSPTKRFLKIINKENILNDINNLNYNDRLKYGLELYPDEYDVLIKKLSINYKNDISHFYFII